MQKTTPCPRCVSTSTLCLATGEGRNDFRCRECGHAFNIPNTGKKPMQRVTDTRRKMVRLSRTARAS